VQKTFEDFSRRSPVAGLGSDMLTPKIDIAESKDAINVTAELPGVEEKDVDVTLADGVLTIRGEKKSERGRAGEGQELACGRAQLWFVQ
jgi:HSP20 family protein